MAWLIDATCNEVTARSPSFQAEVALADDNRYMECAHLGTAEPHLAPPSRHPVNFSGRFACMSSCSTTEHLQQHQIFFAHFAVLWPIPPRSSSCLMAQKPTAPERRMQGVSELGHLSGSTNHDPSNANTGDVSLQACTPAMQAPRSCIVIFQPNHLMHGRITCILPPYDGPPVP